MHEPNHEISHDDYSLYSRVHELECDVANLKEQLDAANRRLAHLEGDKAALQMALDSTRQECNHWASQYAHEHEAKDAAEAKLKATRGLVEAIKNYRAYMPDVVYTICERAIAQIDQPQALSSETNR